MAAGRGVTMIAGADFAACLSGLRTGPPDGTAPERLGSLGSSEQAGTATRGVNP